MTLKEADEVAIDCLPVLYQGIEYLRITQIGYTFNAEGERSNFVQLLDSCKNSVVYADPALCTILVKETEQ